MTRLHRIYADDCYVYGLTKFLGDDFDPVKHVHVRRTYLNSVAKVLTFVQHLQIQDEEHCRDDPPVLGALSVICQRSVRYDDDGNIIAQWHKWKIIEKIQDEWHERLQIYDTLQEAKGTINEIVKMRMVGDDI